MFTKPSKILGWMFTIFFVLAGLKFYKFFVDKKLYWEIERIVDTFFIYVLLFTIAVYLADLWRDSYEKFEKNCLNYCYKGKWLNDEYKNVYLSRNSNAFIWILEKVIFVLAAFVALILFASSMQIASYVYSFFKTSYTLINVPIFFVGIMLYVLLLNAIFLGSAYVSIFVLKKFIEKYPNSKIANLIKNYIDAKKFLSDQSKLKDAQNALIEFNKKQEEIFKLGLVEYSKNQSN